MTLYQGNVTLPWDIGSVSCEGAVQQAVAYYRVSTQQQGKSGLGLEAQKEAVERFAAAEGF